MASHSDIATATKVCSPSRAYDQAGEGFYGAGVGGDLSGRYGSSCRTSQSGTEISAIQRLQSRKSSWIADWKRTVKHRKRTDTSAMVDLERR